MLQIMVIFKCVQCFETRQKPFWKGTACYSSVIQTNMLWTYSTGHYDVRRIFPFSSIQTSWRKLCKQFYYFIRDLKVKYLLVPGFYINLIQKSSLRETKKYFSCRFLKSIIFTNLNSNCSNALELRNPQEQVKKDFCFKNCTNLSQIKKVF